MNGRNKAHKGLLEITAKRLLSNDKCRGLLEEFARIRGGGATAESLAAAIEQQAWAMYRGWYVYDGPSASGVTLDEDKFPGTATSTIRTVAQWFASQNGAEALSQYNGDSIFIQSEWWGNMFNSYTDVDGELSAYGFATLLHEILHKRSVGGFTHDQMLTALRARGLSGGEAVVGKNIISVGIGNRCN